MKPWIVLDFRLYGAEAQHQCVLGLLDEEDRAVEDDHDQSEQDQEARAKVRIAHRAAPG